MMTSHLKLFKLFGLGHNAEDVGFCSLRVESLIESLHTMRKKKHMWLMIILSAVVTKYGKQYTTTMN